MKRSSRRLFYVGMALLMIVIIFLGFWPTYISPMLSGGPSAAVSDVRTIPWFVHLHATVFLSWMALLLTQTTLIARNKTPTHMAVGQLGFTLGVLVLLIGLLLTYLVYKGGVVEGQWTWAEAPFIFWPPLIDMVEFSILLAIGYRYRTRPEVHKRMMLFATVALLHAATGVRMDYLLGAWTTEIMFVGLVSLIYTYDFATTRRVHPASLVGTLIVLPDVAFYYLPGLGP